MRFFKITLKGFGVLFSFWFLKPFSTAFLRGFFYPSWSFVLKSNLGVFLSKNTAFPVMMGPWQLEPSEHSISWVRVADKPVRLALPYKTPCWSCSQHRDTQRTWTPHRAGWRSTLPSAQSSWFQSDLYWLPPSPKAKGLDSGGSPPIPTFPSEDPPDKSFSLAELMQMNLRGQKIWACLTWDNLHSNKINPAQFP